MTLQDLLNPDELFENVADSLSTLDIEQANMAMGMKKDVEEVLHSINRKLTTMDARDALHLRIVPDSIDRIGDYGVNIAEIAINSTISK